MSKIQSEVERDVVAASERSRALWLDPGYRNNHGMVLHGHREESRYKISVAVREKFQDREYIDKIRQARTAYWSDPEYRSARTWSKDRFVAAAVAVHGDRYNYECADYINFKHKITIVCSVHGAFEQLPGHHIHFGNGCPSCAAEATTSAGECELADWIDSFGVQTIRNDRELLGGMELDIYIPDCRLAVEYSGIYKHSLGANATGPQRYRHHYKATLAAARGIRLLQFYDTEWRDRREIVESMIRCRLGLCTKVHARSCTRVSLSDDDAAEFMNRNHLYGHRAAGRTYGLTLDGELVSVLSVTDYKERSEVIRFASKVDCVVVGGLSRLLAAAVTTQPLSTYADRRYSTAESYLHTGFKLTGVTPPGYKYVRGGSIYSRQRFQKHKLGELLEHYDPMLSESANMFAHGYRKLWDAGHYRLLRAGQ